MKKCVFRVGVIHWDCTGYKPGVQRVTVGALSVGDNAHGKGNYLCVKTFQVTKHFFPVCFLISFYSGTSHQSLQ